MAAYLACLAAVGFWPTPVDKPIQGTLASILGYLHDHGVPGWFNYKFIEASANVVLFIPFGILIAMSLPGLKWWRLVALGALASICIELGQLLFMAARFATLMDILMNTAGALIGVAIVRLILRKLTAPPTSTTATLSSHKDLL
ncbi:VanZ family protein [Paenarthrobacter sp. YJN-5]|uniref:VanZ family protein n=1 Tax=Paenarthrobacter sp. YJN-5 TaxID=2735316 RepID=UPI0018786C66|nr:VanZ family protein [Paenarthrobacter sp. YJN-5]QOT16030.1 VanZ family protein [Paenarthrobacter sp. YJN-5]